MATDNDNLEIDENEVSDLIDAVTPEAAEPEVQEQEEEKPSPKYKPSAKAQPSKSDTAKQRQMDRDAGRAAFKDAYEKKAKALGFDSLDEMFNQRTVRQTPGQTPPKAPQNDGKYAQKIADLEETVRTLRAEIRSAEGKVRHWRSQCENLQNEMTLRHDAYLAEVDPEEVDAVLSKLDGHFKRLPDAKRKEFDHNEFFKELKTKKPAYFRQYIQQTPAEKKVEEKIEELPANTSSGGPAPKASAKEIKEQVISDTQIRKNAMQMTRQEFEEFAKANGVSLGDM